MIKRYTRPVMGKIWTEENKLRTWLAVELAALDALAQNGDIPKRVPASIRKRVAFNPKEIRRIESVVQHDVIAFVTNAAAHAGPDGRYLHFGLTSSDVLDTALALQIKDASVILTRDLNDLIHALRKQAIRTKYTVMAGRSHGVHAEPLTFGLKMALFYAEFKRHLNRFEQAASQLRYGKISGAVGTFAHVSPKVEAAVCRRLGLKPEPISTQIIQRDRHAEYFSVIALIGCSLEKLATEIRGLQKTETREAEEPFGKGQKGSSAMPHKRNPVICERVAGLSRLLRGNALAAFENVTLWHERDITHSSVERVIFPDSTILLDYMLDAMTHVIDQLAVYPQRMLENLEKSRGMVFSQGLLLRLIQKGLTREKAYSLVQSCAKKVWENGRLDLREAVQNHSTICRYLNADEINTAFDYKRHTKYVDFIFKRVGISS